MTGRILIVGAGAIGARHLQGLARLARPLHVDVVDPSAGARDLTAARLAEAGGLKGGEVRYHADLSALAAPDVAIVATNARERAHVVADLARLGTPRFLLEKVLFTRFADYDAVAKVLAQHGAQAWVNCVRRAYPRASDLIEMVGGKPFSYSVRGEGWGLGCNVIHHLDEVAMLSGRADIRLSPEALLPQTIPSKRAGYVEFLGTMTGTLGDNTFLATCGAGAPGDRVVTITCADHELHISQLAQTLTIANGKGSRTESFPIPLQSEATAYHVEAMLDGRAPALVDYETAATLHRAMLATLLAHLRAHANDPHLDEVPIT
jgi:hypothetical protein